MKSSSLSPLRVSLIALGAVVAGLIAFAEVAMNPKIVQLQAFNVVGTSVSTNNAKEMTADAIIGKQWQQFLSEHLADKIPNRIDHDLVAVYTDYTSDANGEYTFILGARVQPTVNPVVPEGMVVKTVPAQRYAVFTSERGPVAKVVVETWKQIWTYFQTDQHGKRAYLADFELYDQRAADPNNAQVDIYVGVQ